MSEFTRSHPLLRRFDLTPDQAPPHLIDEGIRASVPFRGTNLWLLIFAIVIASVGLNVNSTAVIIGAMLVSPLMGPIMGVGYGVAVADFALMRLALWNLMIATMVSLTVSTAYFWLTPLAVAHSELLSRTSPSIWDVLIALAGGLAGIVGVTRREKSNVIPGVAIATALMPPLCTAGFGIASGNLVYFAGAFYLFFINSVFIAAATFVMCRLMALPEVAHSDAQAARRAHRWLVFVVVCTALPSVVLAQRLVAAEIYATNAAAFIAAAFPPDGATFVVKSEASHVNRQLRLTVMGAPVTDERREALAAMLPSVGLESTSLVIAQSHQPVVDVASLRKDIAQDLYQHTLTRLDEREREVASLRAQLEATEETRLDEDSLEREVMAQQPDFARVTVTSRHRADALQIGLLVESPKPLLDADRERLTAWLRVRTGAAAVWILATPVSAGAEAAPDPSPPSR